jgi:YidC/Oxa1 family membrane protein insertase
MIALPFVFVFFILNFPAGLILYWITTNFWTVGQQYFVRRSVGMSVPGRPGNLPQPESDRLRKLLAARRRGQVAAGDGGNGKGPDAAPSTRSAPPAPPRARRRRRRDGGADAGPTSRAASRSCSSA